MRSACKQTDSVSPAKSDSTEQALRERVVELEQALDWQERRFKAVMKITQALGGTFEIDDLLRVIMENTTSVLDAERATLFLVDKDRKEIWFRVMLGGNEAGQHIRLPMGKGIVGWVVENGKALNIEDAYQDSRFNQEIDRQTGYRTRSILCVPVSDKCREVIGAVQVLNKRSGPFTREDELLLDAVAGQAAVALENSRLYAEQVEQNRALVLAQERLQHKMEEMDLLHDIEQGISQAEDLPKILDLILEKACEVMGAEAGSIFLKNDRGPELFFNSVIQDEGKRIRNLTLPAHHGVAGMVATDGCPRLVDKPESLPFYADTIDELTGFRTLSVIAAPLVVGDQIIGAVEIMNKRFACSFAADDLKLLILIAGQAGRAINIVRTRDEEIRAQRLTLLGQMMGGILHDIRTPMSVIGGLVQVLSMEERVEDREKHVESIFRQFDHIEAMTREIMAFAKGQREVLVRKVNLKQFVEEMKKIILVELEGTGVSLCIKEQYRGLARFDENKMIRVITNLARNARQAMSTTGGGELTWEIYKQEQELVFEFVDTGPGIAEDDLANIFDLFSTRGKDDGTGLGLAIVKKIIDEHGGSVNCRSVLGQGAAFCIRLPL